MVTKANRSRGGDRYAENEWASVSRRVEHLRQPRVPDDRMGHALVFIVSGIIVVGALFLGVAHLYGWLQ